MSISASVGLLILRIIIGLTLAGHGAQKALGWFGGPGFTKMQQGLGAQGFKPDWFWTGLVVLGELGGGLSLAFGFLTPLGAAGAFGAMSMAILKTHWPNGFWNSKRGYEFPLALLAAAVALGLAGPGRFALDTLFGIRFPSPLLFIVLAIVALLVDLAGLAISRAPSAAGQASPRAS